MPSELATDLMHNILDTPCTLFSFTEQDTLRTATAMAETCTNLSDELKKAITDCGKWLLTASKISIEFQYKKLLLHY